MARAIGGVILGYLVMAAFIFATFTAFYLLLGADGTFRPGTYDVSAGWIAGSLVLSIVAAILGGWVCRSIARSPNAVSTLAIVVLVLGIVSAVMEGQERAGAAPMLRDGPVGNLDAMNQAVQPVWFSWLLPAFGAAGVLAGGRRKLDTALPGAIAR
jgi:hypothetical protein